MSASGPVWNITIIQIQEIIRCFDQSSLFRNEILSTSTLWPFDAPPAVNGSRRLVELITVLAVAKPKKSWPPLAKSTRTMPLEFTMAIRLCFILLPQSQPISEGCLWVLKPPILLHSLWCWFCVKGAGAMTMLTKSSIKSARSCLSAYLNHLTEMPRRHWTYHLVLAAWHQVDIRSFLETCWDELHCQLSGSPHRSHSLNKNWIWIRQWQWFISRMKKPREPSQTLYSCWWLCSDTWNSIARNIVSNSAS